MSDSLGSPIGLSTDTAPLTYLRVRTLNAFGSDWREYLNRTPHSVFHSEEWMTLLNVAYGWQIHVMAGFDELGNVVGGLPYAVIDEGTEFVTGKRRISLPFSDFCDILGPHCSPLLDGFRGDGDTWTWKTTTSLSLHRAFESAKVGERQTIAVEGYEDRFPEKSDYKWRHARKLGVYATAETSQERLEDFFNPHALLRARKYGILPQGHPFFQLLYDLFFPRKAFVVCAWVSECVKPIAACIILDCGDKYYYKFSASNPNFLRWRANYFLLRWLVKLANENGKRIVDLGFSDTQGLIHFKSKLGAVSEPVYRVDYLPRPGSSTIKDTFTTLVNVVVQAAKEECNRDEDAAIQALASAGAALYRYFV